MEGYVAGLVSAGQGHIVGMNCRGHIFFPCLGNALQDRDVYAAMDIVLGRVGRVWQMYNVLLPGPHVVGTRPRVLGAVGFPSWHRRVGEERLWRVVCTVLTDWRQHRTSVRGFVDCVEALVNLGFLSPSSLRVAEVTVWSHCSP